MLSRTRIRQRLDDIDYTHGKINQPIFQIKPLSFARDCIISGFNVFTSDFDIPCSIFDIQILVYHQPLI